MIHRKENLKNVVLPQHQLHFYISLLHQRLGEWRLDSRSRHEILVVLAAAILVTLVGTAGRLLRLIHQVQSGSVRTDISFTLCNERPPPAETQNTRDVFNST